MYDVMLVFEEQDRKCLMLLMLGTLLREYQSFYLKAIAPKAYRASACAEIACPAGRFVYTSSWWNII